MLQKGEERELESSSVIVGAKYYDHAISDGSSLPHAQKTAENLSGDPGIHRDLAGSTAPTVPKLRPSTSSSHLFEPPHGSPLILYCCANALNPA